MHLHHRLSSFHCSLRKTPARPEPLLQHNTVLPGKDLILGSISCTDVQGPLYPTHILCLKSLGKEACLRSAVLSLLCIANWVAGRLHVVLDGVQEAQSCAEESCSQQKSYAQSVEVLAALHARMHQTELLLSTCSSTAGNSAAKAHELEQQLRSAR